MDLSAELKSRIASYKAGKSAEEIAAQSRFLLIAGPSGSGKDTVIKEILKNDRYEFIVSHTTRPPRSGEINGKDYYFIDWQTAEEMIDDRRFLEVKVVYEDYMFGTSIAELNRIRELGKIGITDIDVAGARVYVELNPETKAVFILPPSYDEWLSRLAKRGSGESQQDIQKRLQDGQRWLEQALADGFWHFVINSHLEKAVADIKDYALKPKSAQPNQDERVEHAWHVLGELKKQLSS